MKLETWAAIASLGLSAMSAGLMISLYEFLIGPDHKGPNTQVDPGALLVQEVSISAVPATVISIFVFVIGRSYENLAAGMLIIASGAVMIAGMAAANSLVPQIQRQYVVNGIDYFPYIFIAAGLGTIGLGSALSIISRKRRTQNLDDLR